MAAITGRTFDPASAAGSSPVLTTDSYFQVLQAKNDRYSAAFRGEVNRTYNSYLAQHTDSHDRIPGGEDLGVLDSNRTAPILFPYLYDLAIARVSVEYEMRDGSLTTGALSSFLQHLSTRHGRNIAGLINLEYNRLLVSAGATKVAPPPKIAGDSKDIEELGMDTTTPIANPILYKEAIEYVLSGDYFEVAAYRAFIGSFTENILSPFDVERTAERTIRELAVRSYVAASNPLIEDARREGRATLTIESAPGERWTDERTFVLVTNLAHQTGESVLTLERGGVPLDLATLNAKLLEATINCDPTGMDRYLALGADPTKDVPVRAIGPTLRVVPEPRTHVDPYFEANPGLAGVVLLRRLTTDYFSDTMVSERTRAAVDPAAVLACKWVVLTRLGSEMAWDRRRHAVLWG